MSDLSPPMRAVLRFEAVLVLILSVVIYHGQHYSWGLFAACFLIPDISFLAYVLGKKAGAIGYNLAHSYIGPALCGLVFAGTQQPHWLMAALIWGAHIGFDRALGYGLKYASGFADTHLGGLGRKPRR